MQPVEARSWITVDDAYSGQLAEKARLIAEHRDRVIQSLPQAKDALSELLTFVLADIALRPDFAMEGVGVRCPDGRLVVPATHDPLGTLSQLVQEDLCLMEKIGDEHVLTGAILCFPASWWLGEKLGRPLLGIHIPVDVYNADIARRVQRLFDAIRPEQPLWRMNSLVYRDPSLHQPRREADPRIDRRGGSFVRAERQTLIRLPKTRAVVFAIHTYVVDIASLTAEELAGLEEARL